MTRKPPVLRDYGTPAHKGLGMDQAEHSCYARGPSWSYMLLWSLLFFLWSYWYPSKTESASKQQAEQPLSATLISAGGRVCLAERSAASVLAAWISCQSFAAFSSFSHQLLNPQQRTAWIRVYKTRHSGSHCQWFPWTPPTHAGKPAW